MVISAINSALSAADAYLDASTEHQRDTAFEATKQWLAAAYEQDGCTEDDLSQMNIKSEAERLIEQRRERLIEQRRKSRAT